MKTHPAKLLILFPIYEARDYRRQLTAIDDALVVHRRPDGAFLLELRGMVKLTTRGANSYATALIRLAADLETGHTVIIVDRDQFLADLERLAREHAGKDGQAVERAAQVITERTAFQVRDHMDTDDRQYQVNRFVISKRERRTKARPHESSGLNCMHGIPTPRAEQLWHVIRHELCDPRTNAAGTAAWERWCGQNRPDMPRSD